VTHTHALTPESNQLRIGGSPGTWQEGIEAADKTLDDAKAGDTCGHGSEGCGSEGIG
jgi:hypothetical protein